MAYIIGNFHVHDKEKYVYIYIYYAHHANFNVCTRIEFHIFYLSHGKNV